MEKIKEKVVLAVRKERVKVKASDIQAITQKKLILQSGWNGLSGRLLFSAPSALMG